MGDSAICSKACWFTGCFGKNLLARFYGGAFERVVGGFHEFPPYGAFEREVGRWVS